MTVDDLAGAGGTQTGDELRLTGLEVLGFLAVKVVVPVLCSFVSRELYDRYKELRTRAQAANARTELLASPLVGPQVDPDVVRDDLVAELVAEGVNEALARESVNRALARIGARVVSETT